MADLGSGTCFNIAHFLGSMGAMRHESFEIEDEQRGRAPGQHGATGAKETADLALREAARARLRRQLAARIRSGDGIHRGDTVLADSRNWRR